MTKDSGPYGRSCGGQVRLHLRWQSPNSWVTRKRQKTKIARQERWFFWPAVSVTQRPNVERHLSTLAKWPPFRSIICLTMLQSTSPKSILFCNCLYVLYLTSSNFIRSYYWLVRQSVSQFFSTALQSVLFICLFIFLYLSVPSLPTYSPPPHPIPSAHTPLPPLSWHLSVGPTLVISSSSWWPPSSASSSYTSTFGTTIKGCWTVSSPCRTSSSPCLTSSTSTIGWHAWTPQVNEALKTLCVWWVCQQIFMNLLCGES